jgi:ATP diphosphatase
MTEPASGNLSELLRIMAQLRDPNGGCPWDLQQNFASIAPYTIEEAYEVADAIDRGDMHDLKDELGDLLLQVVFHARMAEEAGEFAFDDVAAAICDKMLRRHPHVFDEQGRAYAETGRPPPPNAGSAEKQLLDWERRKQAERHARGGDTSALAGIARGLPEWQRAVKLQKRAARVGFDWPSVDQVFEKLHEELDEVREELAKGVGHDALEAEIGDVLFVCANLARHAQVDVGAALRRANAKFERRFRRMEELAAANADALESLTLAQQDGLWDQAKAEEKSGSA